MCWLLIQWCGTVAWVLCVYLCMRCCYVVWVCCGDLCNNVDVDCVWYVVDTVHDCVMLLVWNSVIW